MKQAPVKQVVQFAEHREWQRTISCGPPGVGMVKNAIPLDRTGWVIILRSGVFQSRPIP